MNKKEFKLLEKYCKDGWVALFKNGNNEKPVRFDIFRNECPACEIAYHTRKEYFGNFFGEMYCAYCPVDFWRLKRERLLLANKNWPSLGYMIKGNAVCEYEEIDSNGECMEPYRNWRFSRSRVNSLEARKIAAKQISEMPWTFLNEYKKIDMSDYITRIKLFNPPERKIPEED